MAHGSTFTKVFTKRISTAPVKTDKAEEKLLDGEEDAIEEVMDTAEAPDEDDILVNRGVEELADIDDLLGGDEELF